MEDTDNTDNTDIELIRACRRGDTNAWERILERYERLVYSVAFKYDLDRDDAADVAQYTFVMLSQSLNNLHENSRLGAWLWTVARRHVWRIIKKHGLSESLDVLESENAHEIAELIGRAHRQDEDIETWELSNWLNTGLNQLDDRCRELLLALYFEQDEQPSYVDVALRLKMPTGSVGPTRARCLDKLKQILRPSQI